MSEYMIAQLKRIEIEKWYEGIRRQSDPGSDFVVWWILNYGSWFRNAWDDSLCSQCCNNQNCGHEVRTTCNKYNLKDKV